MTSGVMDQYLDIEWNCWPECGFDGTVTVWAVAGFASGECPSCGYHFGEVYVYRSFLTRSRLTTSILSKPMISPRLSPLNPVAVRRWRRLKQFAGCPPMSLLSPLHTKLCVT